MTQLRARKHLPNFFGAPSISWPNRGNLLSCDSVSSGVRMWHIKGSSECYLFILSFRYPVHEPDIIHHLLHSVVPYINTLFLHHFHPHYSCAACLRIFLSTTSTKILPTHSLDITMNMPAAIQHHSPPTVFPNLCYETCTPLAFEVGFFSFVGVLPCFVYATLTPPHFLFPF